MAEVNIDVAKEASVQAVNTKVGTIKTSVDTINTNTATNNTASKTGTLSQKESYGISLLENSTYGLSALKTALTGGSVPVVKSVQRGYITVGALTVTATISSVVTSKSVIHFLGMSSSADSVKALVRLDLTNSTTVTATVSLANSTYPSVVGFEVVEYY